MQAQGQAGVSGRFQFIQMDTSKVVGTGADGQVTPWDLFQTELDDQGNLTFKRDGSGHLIPKDQQAVRLNKFTKNKFTKRGLGRMMHQMLIGHTGGPFAPAEIIDPTINCFTFFALYADQTTPARDGDKRVEWDESDDANVTDLPATTGTIGEGRRGIALSTTAGTFRRLSVAYVNTNPYGVLEYVLFAQANTPAIETGALGLDNFPIKAIALQEALNDAGDATKVGVRAVLGLAPTFQGKSDRVYVHEAQQQGEDLIPTLYTGSTPAGAAGYVQTSALAEVQIGVTSTPSGSSTITAATRTIVVNDAATILPATSGFDAEAHTRKVLRIASSAAGGNNRDYTIQEVVNSTTVIVFEDPAADDTNNFTAGVFTTYQGYNLFDGRVENEGRVEVTDTGSVAVPADVPGTVVNGEAYASVDAAGPHTVGRVFDSDKTIAGVRLVAPAGVNKDNVPDSFKIQLLDPAANGGNPRPGEDADWVDATLTQTTQATPIFDAGVYGVEYTFTPTAARGVRIRDMTAFNPANGVQLAAFMVFEQMTPQALSGNTLELKAKSADSFRTFNLPDVPATQNISDFVTSLNEVLRGYELEAVRSPFGFLWLRGTVAGDNSDLFIDAEAGNAANTELGLPTGASQRTGITQPLTKLPADALTIVYRVEITGDVPGGFA